MNLPRIISIVLLVLSLALVYYLINSVKSTIDEKNMIADREAAVIEKLKFIREAEIAYLEVKGEYTNNWDSLINFVQNGVYYITERKETIIPLSYGADSVLVTIDTIGTVPAKEVILKKNHATQAADDGVFMGFLVSKGERAVKGMKAYTLRTVDRTFDHPFLENGLIENLEDIQVGDRVEKGQNLITYWEYKFNPNIDVQNLAYVPGHDDVKFEIFADKVDKSGLLVSVVEVRNPVPFDPTRTENNTANNRKPLRFGSRTDVTTAGNWE